MSFSSNIVTWSLGPEKKIWYNLLQSLTSFYEQICMKELHSIWTQQETCTIFVCNQQCTNDETVCMMNNGVVKQQSNENLREKSIGQGRSKLKNLRSYKDMYNSKK